MRAALVALAAVLAASVESAPQRRAEPFVPVGVWYGGDAAEAPNAGGAAGRDVRRRDLQTIRALGFNSIRTPVAWANAEPDRGAYRFAALEETLALADEAGLKVILQIDDDAAPEWLGRRYPDARLVNDRGRQVAAAGYCLDHPGVRTDITAFITAAAASAARHGSFYGIDVWNEPDADNARAAGTPVDVCYCAHTQARFRAWLTAKYGRLDGLNAAWGGRFASWDLVEAPRSGTLPASAALIDWKTFVAAKLRADLTLKSDAAAPRGPRPVGSHADAPAIVQSRLGSSDDWWMAAAVDRYGTSLHPKRTARPWSPAELAAALDGIRSAARDRGWWIGALQAGSGAKGAPPVTAADLRLWGWAALSRGASAISYDAWRPIRPGGAAAGAALVEPDGTVTDRARAAGTFADIINRNPGLFVPLRPRPSRVALLYNRLSFLADDGRRAIARRSLLGFFRALFEQNLQVDLLHPDEVTAGLASAYGVVVLPSPVVLSEPVAQFLKAYVREGGTVISEAGPDWKDDRGAAVARGSRAGLDEVFGARAAHRQPVDAVMFVAEPGLDGGLAPLSGRRFSGTGVAERLEVTSPTARVLARFPGRGGAPGDPAVVMSRFGQGRAILIGTCAAAAFEQDPDGPRANRELLQRLAASAGIAPDVRIDGAPGLVEARFLESADAQVLVAINHSERSERVTFTFARDVPEAIWQNMESGTTVNFIQTASGPIYRHTFPPRDVMVLVIKKKMR